MRKITRLFAVLLCLAMLATGIQTDIILGSFAYADELAPAADITPAPEPTPAESAESDTVITLPEDTPAILPSETPTELPTEVPEDSVSEEDVFEP